MTDIAKSAAAPLTAVQQQALKGLHDAATQLEGVFLQLVMSEMDKTVSHDSIFGKTSNSEQVFQSMLNDQRAQTMAKSGSIGMARILEAQLRTSVLSDAPQEAKVHVDGRSEP